MLLPARTLAALILVLASFTPSRADEKTEHLHLYPRDGPEIRAPSFWDLPEVSIAPPGPALVDLLTEKHYAPGQLIIEYGGIQGALVNRILSYHHRYYFRALDDAYNQGRLTQSDIDRISLSYVWGEYESTHGRWWERSFFESFVPERGGAPSTSEVVYVGKERPIFEFGDLTVTNLGKVNLWHTSLYVQRALVDTSSVRSIVTGIVRRDEFKISNYVKFSVRPRIGIKASVNPEEILSKVELDANINVYYSPKKPPIVTIAIVAEYEPFKERGDVKFNATILIW